MKKRYTVLIATLCCLKTMPIVYALSPSVDEQTLDHANTIFNWAERHYFSFFPNPVSIFPSNSDTLVHESGWIYRYYPISANYLGVYNNDVYIAGPSFSIALSNPYKVFSVSEAINEVDTTASHANKVKPSGVELPFRVLLNETANLEIRNGGYGSAVSAHPDNSNQFYALTDRGPTAALTGSDGKGKIFPFPDYAPRIGLFELNSAGIVIWLNDIILKSPQGHAITGLPNSSALGGTGETPYDIDGNTIRDTLGAIKRDDFGLDSEGLVALKDGTFWVSDEYGPHLVHFDASGKEIGRINPFVHDVRNVFNLPPEIASRQANHGMEGLAITPDQSTLVGIMQSPLKNPSKKVIDSTLTRLVTINLETGVIGQYLYRQEKKGHSNSEILALSASRFLVIERDGGFLNGGSKKADPNTKKLIYQINLNKATNLESIPLSKNIVQHESLGLTIKGKTLEEFVLDNGWDGLEKKGIKPVKKKLIVDMLEEFDYPHDKLESLWLIDAHTIGVLNDDDFGSWPTKGNWENKYINAKKTKIDTNTLYIIKGLNLDENSK